MTPPEVDRDRIRRILDDCGCVAVIACWPENVGYLSGFYHPDLRLTWERLHLVVWPSGAEPAFVVPEERALLWNGGSRESLFAAEDTRPVIADVRGYTGEGLDMVRAVVDVLYDRAITRGPVGVEMRSLPAKVAARLTQLLPEITLVDSWPTLNALRQVKSADEVALMTRVNQSTSQALEQALTELRPGQTEREASVAVTRRLWEAGADEISHSVLGAGRRAAQWHPWPTDNVLEDGTLIRADSGIRIGGYTSDIARTAVVGRASREQRDTFARIAEAHEVVVDAICPGVPASDLARLARSTYLRLGLEYRWGLVGHGIGLVLHEEPQLLLDVNDLLVDGMTMEIELGYFGDTGAYHLEDLVHVTANGAINLTRPGGERKILESR